MQLFLVHHADAVGPQVDALRPLSVRGHAQAEWLAEQAHGAGTMPAVIWHSGKLRARQTAEAFLRRCNPFAQFQMVRGLLPDDSPHIIRDTLIAEDRDVLLVGHMPNIRDLAMLLAPGAPPIPLHGLMALERIAGQNRWTESWRADPSADGSVQAS